MPRRADALVPFEDLKGMCSEAYDRYQNGRYRAAEEEKRPAHGDKSSTKGSKKSIFTAFEHKDGLVKSAARPPTCPKQCKSCLEHFRPTQWQETWTWLEYNYTYDDEKAGKVVREHVDKARASLSYVRDKLQRFGNAIAKRWTKKTISKRALLLRSALPSLHNKRWPSADLVYKLQKLDWEDWEHYHATWLLPYLDVETLSKDPAMLLALLHHRTTCSLQDWFASDYEHLRIPFLEGTIGLAYNPHCVVVLEDGYGSLVPWNREAAHRGDMVGFPRAEVTLEAQETLAAFLEAAVKILLEHDALEGNEKWMALVGNDFKRRQASSLLETFSNKPFGPSPVWNIASMAASIESRVGIAKDASVRMQTDIEHVRSRLRCTKNSASFSKQSEDAQQQRILRTIMRDFNIHAYMNVVYADLTHVATFEDESLTSGHAIQDTHEEALHTLATSVDEIIKIIKQDIWDEAMLVSTFDNKYCPCGGRHLFSQPQDLHNDDPLFWCIWEACEHEERSCFELSFLLSHLHQVVSEGSRKDKARVSLYMQDLLEDLAVFSNIRDATRLRRSHPVQIINGLDLSNVRTRGKGNQE